MSLRGNSSNSKALLETKIKFRLEYMDSKPHPDVTKLILRDYISSFQNKNNYKNKRELLPIDYTFLDRIVQETRGKKDALKQLWVDFLDLHYNVILALLEALMNADAANLDLSFMLAEFTAIQGCDSQFKCDPLVLEVAGKLMSRGADIMKSYLVPKYTSARKNKYSSLEVACRNGHEPLIHLYVDSLNANAANYNGILDECLFSVLDENIETFFPPYLQICKYLVSKGARPDRYIPKFNGNALGIARINQQYGIAKISKIKQDVVNYLESVSPMGSKNASQLSDLPIRNVMGKYLNTRSTRALMATSKSVAQATQNYSSNAKQFAKDVIARAESKAIPGKDGTDQYPYYQGCAVVFRISDRQVVDKLGFCGIQYIFAPIFMGSRGIMRLLDMHVISDEMMTQNPVEDLDKILFYYVMLHRNITTFPEFTPLQDHSKTSTVIINRVSSIQNRGLNEALMPNQKEILRRFRSADPLYKQIFMTGYYEAVKLAKEALADEYFGNLIVEDGDAIGDIMDKLARSQANNVQQNTRPNYELQQIKRKARAQVLGEKNSKLRAPFTTSQAVNAFTPSQNRPRGNTLSQLIRGKAASLLQQAQARTANAEKSYEERSRAEASGGAKPKKKKT